MTKQSRISDWLQIGTSLGVIAGLLLVAYELNQNTRQSYGESIRGIHDGTRVRYMAEIETNIPNLYIKAFENPDELSAEEIQRLSSYLQLIIDTYIEWENMYELGIVRYSGAEAIAAEVNLHFASRFGRAWLAANRFWIKSSIVEVLDRELEAIPVLESPPEIDAIKSNLQDMR